MITKALLIASIMAVSVVASKCTINNTTGTSIPSTIEMQ